MPSTIERLLPPVTEVLFQSFVPQEIPQDTNPDFMARLNICYDVNWPAARLVGLNHSPMVYHAAEMGYWTVHETRSSTCSAYSAPPVARDHSPYHGVALSSTTCQTKDMCFRRLGRVQVTNKDGTVEQLQVYRIDCKIRFNTAQWLLRPGGRYCIHYLARISLRKGFVQLRMQSVPHGERESETGSAYDSIMKVTLPHFKCSMFTVTERRDESPTRTAMPFPVTHTSLGPVILLDQEFIKCFQTTQGQRRRHLKHVLESESEYGGWQKPHMFSVPMFWFRAEMSPEEHRLYCLEHGENPEPPGPTQMHVPMPMAGRYDYLEMFDGHVGLGPFSRCGIVQRA